MGGITNGHFVHSWSLWCLRIGVTAERTVAFYLIDSDGNIIDQGKGQLMTKDWVAQTNEGQ